MKIEVYVECLEAQSLLRAGATPGAGAGRVPQLGFHLAGCSACRDLRKADALSPTPTPRQANNSYSLLKRTLNRPLPVTICLVLLLGAIAGSYIGLPLVRAWNDIATMTSLEASAQDNLSSARSVPIAMRSEATNLERLHAQPDPLPVIMTSTPDEPDDAKISKINDAAPVNSGAKAALAVEGNATGADVADNLPALLAEAAAPAGLVDRRLSLHENKESAAPQTTPVAPVPATGAVTILVLGLDARQGEGPLARSDAIMVVRLDVDRQQVTLLSLPRDLWVPIPGFGEGKIDSAYFLGELSGAGADVATQTISQALGIDIDRTVVMNFEGFRSLIDTLGGITIDVPAELYDPNFPTDDYGYSVVHFEAGPQTMDGERALIYSRIRHPDSDFERTRRQQSVVLAIAQKLRDRGVLKNLHDADQLTAAVRPFMRTDLPRAMALNLLWSMRSIDVDNVNRITVDTSLLSETNIGGAYALIAEPGVLLSLGAQLITGE